MWAALHTAHAAPNYAKSSTSVSVDESAQKERLDGGGIVVRVQRSVDYSIVRLERAWWPGKGRDGVGK